MAELITVICKRTVVSTKAIKPGKRVALTVLDRHMEEKYLRIVVYYPSMVGATSSEGGEMTRRLRESFSATITHYPIMCGRLQRNEKGQWMVNCNDAGVRMVEARAKGRLEDWLRIVDRDKELMLVYWEEMYHKPIFWSTFYVQITEFENGGLAIGLSCSHLLADITSATMFIKAWADKTFPGKMLQPPFFHPLPRPINKGPNHKPYTSLINHYKTSINNPNHLVHKRHTTVTLSFSDHTVRACMAMAQPIGATDKSSPSPFEALAGLFWVCISKVKGMRNGLVNMSICMDMRSVLGLDKGFFGNGMVYNKVHPDSFQENDISQAAKSISDVVSKMDNEGIMDLIEWLECNDDQSPSLMNGCDLICASLETVDPFSAIFEYEVPPIRVSYYIEPVLGLGQVLIFPVKSKEGQLSRTVMVTLPRDEAVKLCEDNLILQFSPTILMNANKTS